MRGRPRPVCVGLARGLLGLAVVALAVTPLVPHRVAGAAVEVCTAAGVKRIDVRSGAPASPAGEAAGAHCLVCGAAGALDVVPATASLLAVRIAQSEAPRRVEPLAPKAGGGVPLGARAPPRNA